MEIAQQIRRSGLRAWLLVLLPLLVGGAALYLQSQQPPSYSGTATVLTPAATTQRTGAQYITDFQAALKSDTVAQETAKVLKLTASQVQGGLSAAPTAAGSTLLQVTWSGPSQHGASKIPAAASQQAYTLLVRPRLNALTAQQTVLTRQYNAAQSARDKYTAEIGVQLPPQDYQAVLQQSNQLNGEYQKAKAQGETDTAAALSAEVDKANKSVATLAPQVLRYNQLNSDVTSAYTQLSQVRNDLAEAQGTLDSITAPGTITTNAVTTVSPLIPLVRNVVGAAIVGFGVALLLLLGMSALFGPRRRTPDYTAPGHSLLLPDEPVAGGGSGWSGPQVRTPTPVHSSTSGFPEPMTRPASRR